MDYVSTQVLNSDSKLMRKVNSAVVSSEMESLFHQFSGIAILESADEPRFSISKRIPIKPVSS